MHQTKAAAAGARSRLVLVPPELPPQGLRRPGGRVVSLAGPTMGTTWRVKCCTDLPEAEIVAAAERVLRDVVAQMSTWAACSDISRFNGAQAGDWQDLPDAFWRVLATALNVARDSGGAFDPTVGRLTDLWGFGSSGPVGRKPDTAAVAEALAHVGWHKLPVDFASQRIQQPGGLRLDLSSIAKGFAVDELARTLQRLGIESFLCEIGGETHGAGCKPDGSPWWIRLEDPPGYHAGAAEVVLALCGKAAATSGDWVRNFDDSGERYGHTIDPRRGVPLRHGLVAVTVIADDCMSADAFATAILVLGPEAGLAFAERHNIAARLVIEDAGIARSALSPRLQDYA